jgi:putative heme-binding domain-containing protein
MSWWALESIATRAPDQAVSLFAKPSIWATSLVKERLLKNLAQRWAIPGGMENMQHLEALLTHAPADSDKKTILEAIAATLDSSTLPPMPETLRTALEQHLKAQAGDDLALGIRSGDKAAISAAAKKLKDKNAPLATRASIALAFAEKKDKASADYIESVFKGSGQEALKRALLPAVAKLGDHKIIRAMLDKWEQTMASEKALREAALRTIAGRPDWTKLALAEVDRWQVPTKHFTPDILRQMSVLGDQDILAAIDKHWPGLLAAAPTAEIEKEAARILAALKASPGDAVKGKTHFTTRCAACHKLFGEGNEVAPDLTGYDRANTEFWLSNILTPSLEIREGFGAYVVKLKSGQVLMGIIAQQDAKGIKLRDAANQITELKQADIESMIASPVSLMPPTQLVGLTDADLRDLFAYLMK